MKKNITLWIVLLLVASLFASPLVDASETVFAQDITETSSTESLEPLILPTALPVPATYLPSGDTYTNRPTFTWARKSTAVSYQLAVYDVAKAKNVFVATVGKSSCSVKTKRCSYRPKTTLTFNKDYKWKVLAKYSTGKSAYSAFRAFKTLAGFNSQFNGNSTGWVQRPGGVWKVNSAAYYTVGVDDTWSSVSYDKVFTDFTYQVRLKRIDSGGELAGRWSSGLVIRGTPSFNASNEWDTAYEFLYANNGTYVVRKMELGVPHDLRPFSPTPAIVKNGWNILKVTLAGNSINCYINGSLVWSGSDSFGAPISSGLVGITMYRSSNSTNNNLSIDWATLGMPAY